MSEGGAADRAGLLLQLVPYLLERREVSVADAAVDFQVTPERMREMVLRLTMIGRPGDSGYWQMPHDLFDIDWDLLETEDRIALTQTVGLERAPRLSAREAAALLAGLQLVGSLPAFADSDALRSVRAKLAAGASSTPTEVVVAPAPVDEVRTAVDEALRRTVAVAFTYHPPDAAPTGRTVDPVTVHIADGQWYLQGWCHLRRAMRTFHLDRVSEITVTDIPAVHAHETAPALFQPGRDAETARLRFPEHYTAILGDVLAHAEVAVADGCATATMHVADPRGLRRLAARFGGEVEVITPEDARRATRDWADAALAQYGAG